MDPITAIGLVSGIISFVSFGKDLVKGAIKIHESKDGSLEENQSRELVADEIDRFCVILQPPDESTLAGEEKGLVLLAAKCHELAGDMAKVLNKIKAKDPHSTAQSAWAVLKAKAHEKELVDFERRLDQCATQLHLQLTFFTSRQMTATLNGLVTSASSDASALERLRINVEQLGQSVDTINKEFAEQVCQVMQLQREAVDTVIRQKALDGVRFEEMTRRYEMVEPAHRATFRWIFNASALVYDAPLWSLRLLFGESTPDGDVDGHDDPDWDLEDEPDDGSEGGEEESEGESDEDEENEGENGDRERKNEDDGNDDAGYTRRSRKAKLAAGKCLIHWLSSLDGIFHISGKMGSGKSTMMKLLCEHSATRYELECWAGTRTLVFANFFFWKPGSDLQKNLTGLLRALLHATLETCKDLIPAVMSEYWEQIQAQPWQNRSPTQISNKDIRSAMARLIQNQDIYEKHSFCFFIDGLDEYEGTTQEDQRYMVDLLLRWTKASRGRLKICVSSREHNIFMNAFQADKRIRLHEFTADDMRLYVHGKLKHIPEASTREFLVHEIPSRAHGIFLWTTLVVKAAREQLENDATEDELRALLSSIPEELDDLFRHLFASINKINRRRAWQVFTLLLTGRKYDIKVYLYGLSSLEAAWLKWLTLGKPTVAAKDNYDLGHQVDFAHRTIYDFLKSDTTTIGTERQSSPSEFDVVDALSQITWATHKPTLTTCPRLFPLREIIRMRLGNGLDKARFEYLEHLAGGDRRHMSQSYSTDGDCVVGNVDIIYRDHMCSGVASRWFSSSQEPDICNNTPDPTSCSFGILLLAASEGHHGYLKWTIDNHPSSIDNSHKAILLTYALLTSTTSAEVVHRPAGTSALASLFKTNLVSPQSMSLWVPGNWNHYIHHHPLRTNRELINLELSIWHWYLLWITTWCRAYRPEWGFMRSMPPAPPISFILPRWISAQQRSRTGELLEDFLHHGADPYFVLSVSVIEDVESGEARDHLRLGFEFGRERVRVSIDTVSWTDKTPGSLTKFPLDRSLRLTFREWIENLELPNQDRLISLVERNERLEAERLEAERLAQKAATDRTSQDTKTSGTFSSEDNEPVDAGVITEDEPVNPNKGGIIATLAHAGRQYAQITFLALGVLVALAVQVLWRKGWYYGIVA